MQLVERMFEILVILTVVQMKYENRLSAVFSFWGSR